MPQNQIQFQRAMSLSAFIERYGTEAQCEQALERARWPDGFVCAQCGTREHACFLADGRRYWQCAKCRAQCTVCSGTLFHATKLPLTKWFQAIYVCFGSGTASQGLPGQRLVCTAKRTLAGGAATDSYRPEPDIGCRWLKWPVPTQSSHTHWPSRWPVWADSRPSCLVRRAQRSKGKTRPRL